LIIWLHSYLSMASKIQQIVTAAAGSKLDSMRAVRYYGQKDIRLESVPIPICGKGQVKVDIMN
jgi:hypothetical protein